MRALPTTVAAVAAALLASPAPACSGQALHVTGQGHTAINPATGAFEGPAEFTVDGVPHTVQSSTLLVAMFSLPNGSFRAITSHTFDFGGGDRLTTLDHVLLVPTATPGTYLLNSQLNLTGGAGEFEGATGHFRGQPGSTIDLIGGQAHWSLEGVGTVRP